ILHREGAAWVDRTILAPDAPAPDFVTRTLSARVDLLASIALARVNGGNRRPVVSVTAPAGGTTFVQPTTIVIDAAASDADGRIAKVEFYQGDTLLGDD